MKGVTGMYDRKQKGPIMKQRDSSLFQAIKSIMKKGRKNESYRPKLPQKHSIYG